MSETIKQAEAPKPYVPGTESFELDGKEYSINIGKVVIPGFGERTAAELSVDEEAQKALIAIDGQNVARELVKAPAEPAAE